MERSRLRDIQRRHSVCEIAFELSRFKSALVGEVFALVAEAVDDFGEVVVEFAGGVEVRDDFSVLVVGGVEALEGLLALSG